MLRSTKPWWLLLSALLVPVFIWLGTGADQSGPGKASGKAGTMKDTKKLTPEEERILLGKGTEPAFTGKYWDHHDDGTYRCKLCGAPLFSSKTKFDSGTGWPSFDEALPGAVREVPDADGMRTEIVCARCGGHLGHLFKGEGFTDKGVRHCVNSASLDFRAGGSCEQAAGTKEAFFAGGCFWGVEYWFEKVPGVLSAESGYMGGRTGAPTYEEVCSGETGHIETVRVEFDPSKTSYEALARLFFEIHDPTQMDRQGPDVGEQYRSAVFYTDEEQRATAEALIAKLRDRGYTVVTRLEPAMKFWKAEEYHQDYYAHKGSTPYCHAPVKRFGN